MCCGWSREECTSSRLLPWPYCRECPVVGIFDTKNRTTTNVPVWTGRHSTGVSLLLLKKKCDLFFVLPKIVLGCCSLQQQQQQGRRRRWRWRSMVSKYFNVLLALWIKAECRDSAPHSTVQYSVYRRWQ